MINNVDDNFDDIDLNELFNDFNEKQSSSLQQSLIQYDLNLKTKQNSLIECNENDCTQPKVNRKRTKPKKKIHTKQTTMYDYISIVSCKNRHFYSSLDNSTAKTILKGQKRSLTINMKDCSSSSPISKKSKTFEYDNISSPSPPDFIDNLIRYLDQRSRYKIEQSTVQEK